VGNNPLASHRERHIDYLNNCDICIICYYHASEAWLVTKLQDILKSPGLGRKKPLGRSAVATFNDKMTTQTSAILDRYTQYKDIALLQIESDQIPVEKLKALV
jgi:hypothetical protein